MVIFSGMSGRIVEVFKIRGSRGETCGETAVGYETGSQLRR